MTVSHTPNSSAERKRADRLKIAYALCKALVAKNPDRVITLRDGTGRVVAEPQDKSGGSCYGNLPIHDAPSLVPADGYR